MPASRVSPIIVPPPPELCLIRLSALGDTCHTVPVVRAIQRAAPQTRITWVIGKTEHALLRGLEGVEFAVLDKSKGFAGYFELRRTLAGRRFPVLLHMHPSMRGNLASLAVSADIRIGFDRARAREHQWLFCNRHIAPLERQHVMESFFGFAAALGVPAGELEWRIPIPEADRAFAAAQIEADRPSLVISPCAAPRFRNYRNWHVRGYAEAAGYAAERYGAQVLVTGGPSEVERSYADGIIAQSRAAVRDLVGKTTLKQLLAVLERASVVLCPDSGPAHMSTAVRTPVVGLYATTNPSRAAPYLSRHLVVDKYPEAAARMLGKRVEELRWGTRVRHPEAMNLITLPDVIEKLDAAFAERGIGPLRRAM